MDSFPYKFEDCSAETGGDCEEECTETNCKNGLWCTITECTSSCVEPTCIKEFYREDYSKVEKDCYADRSDDCIDECVFVECEDENDYAQCLVQKCDNQCGQKNCTTWF